MQAVPLAKVDIIAARQSFELCDEGMDEDEELQKALRLSLGENASEYGQETYENFVSHLFACTLEVLSTMLKGGSLNSKLAPILRLLLDLIWNSRSISSQNEWARRFAREVSHGITFLLTLKGSDGVIAQGPMWSIIVCLRSMQLLIFPDLQDSALFFEQLHSDDDIRSRTHPDVVCDVHDIPAVRRRSAKGKNKDRRFYVCGKERGQRCNFFKWADDVELKSRSKSRISSRFKEIVLKYLWNLLTPDESPLNAVLCEFLEKEIFTDNDDEMDVVPSCSAHSHEIRRSQSHIASRYGKSQMERDVEDGVFCSREKLQDAHLYIQDKGAAEEKQDLLSDIHENREIKCCLLGACLGLLALVADYKTAGITRWFSLLCEIDISTARPFEVRSLARNVLKSLCGRKRALYHSIRDHFSFGFQLQALYKNASPILEAALSVSERCRVCSPSWTTTSKVNWNTLPVGGLIGTEDLISASDCAQGRLRKVGEVLDDLWCVIRNGGESWRRFCGQASLPTSHRGDMTVDSGFASVEQKMLKSPPIVALFWVSCALPAGYQVKALRLIDAALADPGEMTAENLTECDASVLGSLHEDDVLFTISGARPNAPETLLLTGDNRFSVDDFTAFAFNVLAGGKSTDVRRIGYHLLTKIVPHFPNHERGRLFQQVFSSKFLRLATTGKGCIEYLNLLQFLAHNLGSDVSLREYGDLVVDTFIHQVDSVRYDRSNGEWVVVEAGLGTSIKRKFDLSECLYCLQTKAAGKEGQRQPERRDSLATTRSPRGSHESSIGSKHAPLTKAMQKKWHSEQVSPFSRYRIEALKLASSSNEFSAFFALRHRVVLSDVALTVNDPRGRFVKNISVYYSSKPADNAAELKADEYALQWHKCASLSLPRGATRANVNIAHPVVAANLKIEYTDFYERPGGSKASDGSLLVHCPRCTRGKLVCHHLSFQFLDKPNGLFCLQSLRMPTVCAEIVERSPFSVANVDTLTMIG